VTRFPLSHVLGLYEQVAKRLARLFAFLDEAEQSAVAGERELLRQMRSSLDLDPFFDFLVDVARFNAEQVTDLDMLREWLTGYFAVSNLVHEIQKEISLLTSLPPLPAEIYTALSSLLPKTYKELLTPTILYTSSSVPEHFRRSRGMSRSGTGRTVIRLPYIDRNAPVMWALLCHELAHAIDGHVGLTTRVLDRVKSL
jgi:hypothetical protein